ncbi:type VII secretion protein EccCa [Gordonia sp. TBRC 11910]|uniref:Type VII secretion protein EccCa n=1 Tax=Gordonia asplenii TaxID=2725283 RepID=A0A848KRC6_9ACTN|nr:type VII secretion protein EccCa [Gordonia asplenii]
MGTRLVHRPARLHSDPLPKDPLVIARVPSIESTGGGQSALRAILPLFAGLGMMAMMMSSGNPIRMIAGGAMVTGAIIGGIAMLVYAKTGARKKAEQQRGVYVQYLAGTRSDIENEIRDQRELATRRHPAPANLLEVIRDPSRLWERRPTDPDFLTVRIGSGVGPLARTVRTATDDDPLKRPEPVAQAHLDRVLALTERIDNLPIAVPLAGVVSVVGPPELTYEAVRAMAAHVAAFHAPDDVRIHLALPVRGLSEAYRWALWLPHILDPERFDGPLGRRQTSTDADDLTALTEEIARRRDDLAEKGKRYGDHIVEGHHLIIVMDSTDPHGREVLSRVLVGPELRQLKIVLVVLNTDRQLEPGIVDSRVTIADDRSVTVEVVTEGPKRIGDDDMSQRERRLTRGATRGSLDVVSVALAENIGRRLAPIRLVEDTVPDAPLETTITLDRLLGIDDFGSYDIDAMWAPRPLDDFLNVPFGVDATGSPVRLNLKESAQDGMGPHGLCVGATGSGKSEVLRTLVLAQAVWHSPERLALVLVDYKGGAAFAGLDQLPHTTAMVDNLSDDAGLVDRLHDAILGEMQRRQQVLQAAGSLPNVTEYNRRRDAGQDLEPLPDLLVIIDEFGEILTAKPDFIDLFVQIGRIGRSIGVHLLLATQRLEESKLRGLESHLSYRIALRTFSAQESRTVIGSPDAHQLPPIPGSGILKVDPDIFSRFKAAYVSGKYVPPAEAEDTTLPPIPMPFGLNNSTSAWLADKQLEYTRSIRGTDVDADDDPFSMTTLDMLAVRLGRHADRVRQIWLPPLPSSLTFDAVVGPIEIARDRGLTAADRTDWGQLRFPIGLKDRPLRQWQGPFILDLAGSGGHMVFIGSPQSGKTTALRALVLGAALTHTPDEAAFYLIDMAGSGLRPMARLPHVGDVATRFDTDRIRRTVAEMMTQLAERERIFADHQLETVEQMRQLHRVGKLPELRCADVFLVIDGWWTFREEYEELAREVQEFAARGLGFGLHLIVTTGRWADFRVQMQGMLGTRVEMRLNDPLDSTIGRRLIETIRPDNPGRCVDQEQLMCQVSTPSYGAEALTTSEATITAIADAWRGANAPAVRMLPDEISLDAIKREHPSVGHVVIGVNESDLMPARLDLLGTDQHLLVLGDSGSGKTNIARTIVDDLCPRFSEGQLVFAVFDLKRQLMDIVPTEFIGGYAGTVNVAAQLVLSIVKELERRVPPDDITTQQLRERSWWSGPEVVIIADDYDLMEGTNSPLRPLVPFLPQARDLGFHVVVLRRGGGASRAMYEPVIQALKESGSAGLLLSGDRQEGQMWPKAWMSQLPPGRGDLIQRGKSPRRIQLALVPADAHGD